MSGYLADGLPVPVAASDGLDNPYWEGLAEDRLVLQRCAACDGWQWGPEWICHRCRSFDVGWQETEARDERSRDRCKCSARADARCHGHVGFGL